MKKYEKGIILNNNRMREYASPNLGMVVTDDKPNYAGINYHTNALQVVRKALKEAPQSVKFYRNFCYVGTTCYNGITEAMVKGE